MRVGIYPGTFDPVTLGHVDVVERASRLFDRLIIGVSRRDGKAPLFSTEERIGFLRDAIRGLQRVEVQAFSGLLVHFADAVGASTVVRGLRGGSDFDDELQMAIMNRLMAPHTDTILLMTRPQFMGVSSSLIREIAKSGGEVTPYVSPEVAQALAAHYKKKKGSS